MSVDPAVETRGPCASRATAPIPAVSTIAINRATRFKRRALSVCRSERPPVNLPRYVLAANRRMTLVLNPQHHSVDRRWHRRWLLHDLGGSFELQLLEQEIRHNQ